MFRHDYLYDTRTNGNAGLVTVAGLDRSAVRGPHNQLGAARRDVRLPRFGGRSSGTTSCTCCEQRRGAVRLLRACVC